MNTLATTSAAPLYAGFWRRAAAASLDWLVLVIPNAIINQSISDRVAQLLVYIIVGCGYYAGFHSSNSQATLGKRAFGIKVTDLEGGRINLGRAIGRYFAVWVSFIVLGIGILLAAFTQKRQALHDMLCGTLVVNRSAQPNEIVAGGGVMPLTVGVKIVAVIFVALPMLAGILAAIAMPAYDDYKIRARVSEAVVATNKCRTAISEMYRTSTAPAIGANNWGCGEGSTASQYLSGISINGDGVITVTLSADDALGGAKSRTLLLTPTTAAGAALTWSGAGNVQVGSFKCAPGVANPIPTKYLSQFCRG